MTSWSAGSDAGIRPDDSIVGWTQGDTEGLIRSPLDLEWVLAERSPRGPVDLITRRDGQERMATLEHGDWGLEVEPADAGSPETVYWRRVQAAESGDGESLETLAQDASTEPHRFLVRARAIEAIGGDRETMRDAYQRLVDELRATSAGTPLLAKHLDLLAQAKYVARDARAVESAREALRLYEGYPNTEVERSLVTNRLANLELRDGEHEAAEGLYRRAHELRAAATPRAPRTAALLGNLGLSLRRQGRPDEAERVVLEALEILLAVDPQGVSTAFVLRNLGLLAMDKGDYEAAEGYYERALGIFVEARPDGIEVAGMELNLGNVARSRGKPGTAERRYRRALELRRQLDGDPVEYASSLHNLASVVADRGRHAEAIAMLEEALALKEHHVPDSPLVASTLYNLGRLHLLEGNLDEAYELQTRGLRIRRSVVGDSADTAESLFGLARIAEERAEVELAYETRLAAVAILEAQRGRMAFGDGERSRYSARFHEEYRALAEFLVDNGRPAEAFEFLEASRGRSLRALVSQRELAPRGAEALTRERHQLESRLARTRSRLARIAAGDDEAYRAAQSSLRDIQARLDAIGDEMTRRYPERAARAGLERVDLDAVRDALPADARLLSYSVGSERTMVFVVSPREAPGPGIRVHSVPVARDELLSRVDRLRAFIERGRTVAEIEPPLVHIAHGLYRDLWAPVAEDLAGATRAIVVAEGPLLDLPFGALVTAPTPTRFLAETMPTSFYTSAATLLERRDAPQPGIPGLTLVALGDPATAGDAGALPHAREEVERIAALFETEARTYVGERATEAVAKELAPGARFVHLAAHGIVDPRFPLSSSVLLAASADEGASEDGRLHAWEVAEQLELSARLVVLSGCETASGVELAGEGVMGLARAFRVAGAASVLGSLWKVSDQSTSELMARFYESVRRGEALDASLAEARRAMIGSAAWRHPYHWAAFRLVGRERQGGGRSNAVIGDADVRPSSSADQTLQ